MKLVTEKQSRIERDIAFDLLLDKVSGHSAEMMRLLQTLLIVGLFFYAAKPLPTALPDIIPVLMMPFAKALMLMLGVIWLGYAFVSARRQSKLEQQMVRAQIDALKLQQLSVEH
jgi:hypothetical protein